MFFFSLSKKNKQMQIDVRAVRCVAGSEKRNAVVLRAFLRLRWLQCGPPLRFGPL